MKARDVMSSPVITLRADTPVHAAASLLVSHGYAGAPVVDAEGHVVGIATEADLVRGRVVPESWEVTGERPDPPVSAVMTLSPTSVHPDEDLADVVALMLDTKIRSVPIVGDGRLVGIVSRQDVLRAVARRELTSRDAWAHRAGMASHARGDA